jgi:hypothetical protein
MCEPQNWVLLTFLGWGKELQCRRKAFLVLSVDDDISDRKTADEKRTSRSNSSGPARGRRRYGRMSIPGAGVSDGGTVT